MEAGKVMGLAPYGNSTITWQEFFSSSRTAYFAFAIVSLHDSSMTTAGLILTAEYQDLASSVQTALEIAIFCT